MSPKGRVVFVESQSVGLPEEVFVLVGEDEVAAEKIQDYMNTGEARRIRRQRLEQLRQHGGLHDVEFYDVWNAVVRKAGWVAKGGLATGPS